MQRSSLSHAPPHPHPVVPLQLSPLYAVRASPQLFSVICPDVNFRTTANGHPKGPNPLNASDTEVLVHRGELIMGTVDKKTVRRRAVAKYHSAFSCRYIVSVYVCVHLEVSLHRGELVMGTVDKKTVRESPRCACSSRSVFECQSGT
jgi:hypothetical protein